MKEPRHDEERIAALLAGRLEGPERDELLAHLSTADEDYDAFANTAAILREMEEEDAQAEEAGVQVADPPPRRETLPPSVTKRAAGWRRSPRWAGTSAVVGLVALVLLMLPRGSAGNPVRVAHGLARPGAAVSAPEVQWNSVTRGEGSSGAVQAGASLLRLAVAIQTADSAATATQAVRIKERFDDRGGTALLQIAARAGAPPGDLEPLLEQATERLEGQMDGDGLRLGAWLEGARLAAITQDAAFFRGRGTRTMLRRAGRLAGEGAGARAALEGVRAGLAEEGARDWKALAENLETLLTSLGTGPR